MTTTVPERATRAMSQWHIPVTDQEAAQLAALAEQLTADPSADPEAFCREARRAGRDLPPRIAEALWDFRRWGSVSGVLVIANVPVGGAPQTPVDNSRHLGEGTTLAKVQAIFNEFLGQMVAYEAEGEGRLFQDMVPSPKQAAVQTSLSSAVELELHTEQAFSLLRPDYVSLACLRGDAAAHTYVMTARDLVTRLSPDEVAALREPRWLSGVDESFRSGGAQFVEGDTRGPMPILSGSDDDPFIVLDQDLMRGTDDEAQALFAKVIELYRALRHTVTLTAGDVLLLDNARAVHGRSQFEARFDGTDRFVVRSFVTCDLGRSRHARLEDSRVIAGRFS